MSGNMLFGDRPPQDNFGDDGDSFLLLGKDEADTVLFGPKTNGSWAASVNIPLQGPFKKPAWWLPYWQAWAEGWGVVGPLVLGWLLWGTNH